MKRLVLALGLLSVVAVLCSCGSLTQHVGGKNLSRRNLDFAHGMIREPDDFDMRLSYNGETSYTDKWASSVVPLVPIVYWTTLGSFRADSNNNDSEDDYFAVRKVEAVVPLFYLKHDAVYDKAGRRQATGVEFNLALAFGYEENLAIAKEKSWRCGLVWIPGIGPFLGFGPDYFQFLWIPFSDLD